MRFTSRVSDEKRFIIRLVHRSANVHHDIVFKGSRVPVQLASDYGDDSRHVSDLRFEWSYHGKVRPCRHGALLLVPAHSTLLIVFFPLFFQVRLDGDQGIVNGNPAFTGNELLRSRVVRRGGSIPLQLKKRPAPTPVAVSVAL